VIRLALAAALLVAPVPAWAQGAATAPIDPARQAVAEKVVAALVPNGIYGRIMRDQFPRMMDMMMARMSGMSPADLGQTGEGTVGEAARKKDPHFEERMRIMTRVMGEEMGTLFGAMEPRVRVGLSRAFARKFTVAQLSDMQAFFATPSGAAFASEYLALFADPEFVGEMAGAAPEMIKMMPAIMEKVEAATAHLPPPPKKDGESK
jgi:hypothetical protein